MPRHVAALCPEMEQGRVATWLGCWAARLRKLLAAREGRGGLGASPSSQKQGARKKKK